MGLNQFPVPASGTRISQQTAAPSSPVVDDLWLDTDEVAQSGSLGALKDFKRAVRTSGDIALGAVVTPTWANVDTGLDIVLAAAPGDMIEYGISGVASAAAGAGNDVYFDVATIVSGSVVTYFASGTGSPPSGGASGWFANSALLSTAVTGALLSPPLAAGDISGGTVTLRLRFSKQVSTGRTLYASTGDPLVVWGKNLGQVGGWAAIQSGTTAWTAYTPVLTSAGTQPVLGSGSVAVGRYTQIGKLVIGYFEIAFGSSGVNVGTGDYYVSLPVAAYASYPNAAPVGQGWIHDNSAFDLRTTILNFQTTTTAWILGEGANFVGAAAPWVWAASDAFHGQFMYEAA